MKNRNAQKSAKGILVAAIVWSLCDVGAAFAQVGMGGLLKAIPPRFPAE